MMNVNDKVRLTLSGDPAIFDGLIDTWEAQTSIKAPTHVSGLDGLIATITIVLDDDGMIGIRLENGVEFMCELSELTLVGA